MHIENVPAPRHLVECASTNDIAREWARDGAPEGATVTADFQTAGRGRRGRIWHSTPGENLLISVVLRPPDLLADAWILAFVAALAVSDALAEFGVVSQLKWPNDILVEGRKVAGVLVETSALSGGDWAAVVGVGVNVNQARFAEDAAYEVRPISMRIALGEEMAVEKVGEAVARCLLSREADRRSHGAASILANWRERMALDFEIKRGPERGIQSSLEDDGRICVQLPDGTFARWGTLDALGTF